MSTTEKPDPVRTAVFLAKLVAEGEAKRIEGMSDEEFLAEQKRKGRDPSQTPSTEEFLERVKALAARQEQAPTDPAVQTVEQVAPVVAMPRPRLRRLVWLIAAALAVALVGVGALKGPDIVGQFNGQVARDRKLAETLRDDAMGICAQGSWSPCKDKLDEAARLDPAGESEPRVQKARADIENANRPGPKVPDKPGQ